METTSRNFVLQLGSLVSLYASLGALLAVVFGIINIALPDADEYYWEYESAQSSVRFGIAMLIVSFPTYIILTRMVNMIRRTEKGLYLTLTRWLVYLSLFVGSSIILGDLVSVIWSFLNGEVTMRFLLKAGSLLVVIGAALYYYILDARGYWTSHESYSKLYAAVASLVVIVVTVIGFMYIDTPQQVREYRIDEQQIVDLQDMQYRVEEYYLVHKSIPESLSALYGEQDVPTAPEGRAQYEYRVVDETKYELCATFVRSNNVDTAATRPVLDKQYVADNYSWNHTEGRTCFTRVVTPLDAPMQ